MFCARSLILDFFSVMTQRPDYKNHPVWNDAMALTREAYAVADRARGRGLDISKRLRQAAVAVPAHVASALGASREGRREHMVAARMALEQVCRQAARANVDGWETLCSHAADLDRSMLFEFGAAEAIL